MFGSLTVNKPGKGWFWLDLGAIAKKPVGTKWSMGKLNAYLGFFRKPLFFKFSFLATLCGIWDLRSPTVGMEPMALHWELGVLTTGLQGSPQNAFMLNKLRYMITAIKL